MDYLMEVSRIVDGAVKGNRAKVLAYVEQLARKLRAAGDASAADRLLRTAQQTKTSEVTGAGLAPRLPVDGESRLSLADEEQVAAGTISIVLDPMAEHVVSEFLRYVRASDRLIASHVGIAPSMLIYGPPGVGKTELARFIASHLQLPLLTARTDSLISSFLGSTAKNLRILFEHAASRPCILFLDELDSLGKLRDDEHELGELKRVVVSLLQNIDALGKETVLLAATNHHHLLDPAIWRRFSYKLEMGLPAPQARQRLFEMYLNSFIPPAEDVAALAALAEGATGADIRQMSENAIREAVLADRRTAEMTDLLRGIVQFRLGQKADFTQIDPQQVRAVYELAPKTFTMKRLATLFNSSEPTINRRLNEGGKHAAQRKASAD